MADTVGIDKVFRIKSEIIISLAAHCEIAHRGNTNGTLLMHNVNKAIPFSDFTRLDALNGKPQLFFIVETWKALIAVKADLVICRNLPHTYGNPAVLLGFNG